MFTYNSFLQAFRNQLTIRSNGSNIKSLNQTLLSLKWYHRIGATNNCHLYPLMINKKIFQLKT